MPLEVAADRGLLLRVDGIAGQQGVEGGPQVPAVAGQPIAGTAGIQLAPVHQPLRRVEQERIRRAGRPEGPGYVLVGVEQVGKAPALVLGLAPQALGAVLGWVRMLLLAMATIPR